MCAAFDFFLRDGNALGWIRATVCKLKVFVDVVVVVVDLGRFLGAAWEGFGSDDEGR